MAIFGLLLFQISSPRVFKNGPIWSHWKHKRERTRRKCFWPKVVIQTSNEKHYQECVPEAPVQFSQWLGNILRIKKEEMTHIVTSGPCYKVLMAIKYDYSHVFYLISFQQESCKSVVNEAFIKYFTYWRLLVWR